MTASGSDDLRVLLVVQQLRRSVPGGIGTYAEGILAGLSTLGAGRLAGPGLPGLGLYASRPPGREDPLERYGLPLHTSVLPGPALTRAWDRGLLRAPGGFDVIHAVSLAAPQVQAGSLVVVVHDLLWRTNPEAYPSRGRRWHEAALGRALRRARRLVVPSDEVATQLIGAGADPGRVVTVAPGCDHLPPPDLRGAERLLHQLGVPGDFLLSVGTLEPRKNLPRLLAAYAAVRTRLPGPLVVVGPTGWGSDLDLGHAEGVVPAGRVEAPILAALYAKARLLAYVPLAEGFGLPPVEAMWAGIPVVASALPSTGGAAFEVDPLDVDAIAAGLETVAGDEELRDRLVRAGRDHTTGLTWEAAARRHLDLWAAI